MSKRDRRKALLAEARTLMEKAAGTGGLASEDVTRSQAIRTEVEELSKAIESEDGAREALKSMVSDDLGTDSAGTKAVSLGGGASSTSAKSIMAEVQEKAGTGSFKAVTATGGSVTVPVHQGVATMSQSNYLLSNLVTIFPANGEDGDGVSYLRQIGRTLAAATVARGAEKPNSSLSFEGVTDAFATVAHLAEVPNQYLESFGKFAQIIEFEMLYGMALGLDDLLLNGGTDENGEPVTGLLGLSGVKVQAFVTDKLLTLRRAVGRIQSEGTQPTAIVLHPDDWEEIETTKITDQSFLLDGTPTRAGQPSLWGVPVQLAPSVGVGRAVVGAFDASTIGLANRGGTRLQWNPFKLDHLNQTVLRVEGRFVPVIARPASFAVAQLSSVA
ncbi:phage major capsid protein [Arthrobacter agilis]|uniref:phage major capsid protein n=1 Tax=Arthrobacter agilis TaxID=37921 RepID=UPI000B360F8A|nr:phage major capsid protein [Arthrobacter agilis]OUM41640.1 phage major capsid protein [Arthrobacter agilis]PPB47195.1 phage major capsid protein [Arthrobacter agilis]TPV26785.1 phage major capsid protein [Arthrobacter agilis]VDR33107.1 phage major capsid protein, HK97 family [Arthrobacter agilis]